MKVTFAGSQATNIGSGIEGFVLINHVDQSLVVPLWESGSDWDSPRVGLEIVNCVDFRGIDLDIEKFSVGIRITAGLDAEATTCGFGVYELGRLDNNRTGLALVATGGARLLSNTFYSGYFSIGANPAGNFLGWERPTPIGGLADTRHVYIRGGCHGTRFYNAILEGAAKYFVELVDDASAGQAEVPSDVLLAACHLEADATMTTTEIRSDGRNVAILGGSLWGATFEGTAMMLGEQAGPHLLLNVQTSGQRWFPVEGERYDDFVAPPDADPAIIEDGVRVFGMYSPNNYSEWGIAFWLPDLVYVEG